MYGECLKRGCVKKLTFTTTPTTFTVFYTLTVSQDRKWRNFCMLTVNNPWDINYVCGLHVLCYDIITYNVSDRYIKTCNSFAKCICILF